MSIITMPTGLLFGAFEIGQLRFDVTEASDANGATAARLTAPPRWTLSIASPSKGISEVQAAEWEAMLLQLRGNVNHLAAWDVVKNAPRGTMRGTLTLNGAHAQGAVALSVTGGGGQAGTTLKKGDWLQIGSGTSGQLVKVMADATANGSGIIAITVEPPIRPAAGYAGGTAVTWDKALGHYKMSSKANGWSYRPGWNTVMGFALDLTEQWT